MKGNLEKINEALQSINALADALRKAGLFNPGKHRRTGFTKRPLGQRRVERRKKNKAAKAARKKKKNR